MIYCGYQGVGKSTYCRAHKNAYDLDSSNFEKVKGWEIKYIEIALDFVKMGYDVFVSAHREVLEYLAKSDIPFKLVIPASDKDVWRNRLEFRYSKNKSFPNLCALYDFDQHFDDDMKYYAKFEKQYNVSVIRVTARIITTLEEEIMKER